MTVEEELVISKDAHLRKIENDPVNIARSALKSLEINPLPDQKTERIIEELKSMPYAPHDDAQDAMKTIIDFGTRNGYPVFYVLTEDEVPPASYFNGVKVSGKMHMFRLPEIAADFAGKNNGILARYDGPLPAFCRSHHCTERGPKCDKCAYTAFSSSHRRWLEA